MTYLTKLVFCSTFCLSLASGCKFGLGTLPPDGGDPAAIDAAMTDADPTPTVSCSATGEQTCLARTDCHALYNVQACDNILGYCAEYLRCVDGAALCTGVVACATPAPYCTGPYVTAYGPSGACPEPGCVREDQCQHAPPPDGGTLGQACVTPCSGTSNCDPGQYCPDSCLTCPCTDTCHAQTFVCTVGVDQTCNDDPAISSLHGHCVGSSTGPVGSSCTCNTGFSVNPMTGKCT